MNKNNRKPAKKWWERFDRSWHRVPYDPDGHTKHFWTRNCGLFELCVEPTKDKSLFLISVTSLDGSIENCYSEDFTGLLRDAKYHAMVLAREICRGLADIITVRTLGYGRRK
jgi:hypothetical protein